MHLRSLRFRAPVGLVVIVAMAAVIPFVFPALAHAENNGAGQTPLM
jgi:hypothetical protein